MKTSTALQEPQPALSSEALAKRLRLHVLEMITHSNSSHIGSCYSIADILAVLYGEILRVDPTNPTWPTRDRFVLSKGHAAAVLYAVLAERGFFPVEDLKRFNHDGTFLSGHVLHKVPGVEVSTGALGHGLSLGLGMAYAARCDKKDARTFVLLSDGECDEGSIWEAILFAGHHKVNQLTAIVDYNKIQSLGRVEEVMSLEPFADKWTAFGWEVIEIDGHNHAEIRNVLSQPVGIKPRVVIAHTVKGKGVSFMEDTLLWHYKSPNPEQYQLAFAELNNQAGE